MTVATTGESSSRRHRRSASIGMRRSLAAAAVVVVLALLAVACGGGSSSGDAATTTSTTPAWNDPAGTWTVLAYVAADNNLEGAAIADLVQMSRTRTTKFIVLIDRIPENSSADLFGLGPFTDSRLLEIQDGAGKVLQTPGEIDMGSPDTLSSFISYGLQNHKGQKNALVVWDHGGAWKGVAWDDSSPDPATGKGSDGLTLTELSSAVKRGLTDAGVARFDMIGFDACLMATYDVAMAIQPFADVMVASEELEPGHGWNWTSLGTAATGSTTAQFADAILQGYKSEAAAANQTDITLSALDLHALPALTAAIDALTAGFRGSTVRVGRVGYGRNQAIGFGKNPNPKLDYFSVDLGDFMSEIENTGGVKDAVRAIHDAIHEVVMRRVSGVRADASSGIAVYFPSVEDYLSPAYPTAGTAGPWLRALDAYFAAVDKVPSSALPTFIDPDRVLDEGQAIVSKDALEMIAKVTAGTGGNIIAGSILFGQVEADGDTIDILGKISIEVAGDTVSGMYGWRYLVVSDGSNEVAGFASIELDAQKNITRITIPIVLTDGVSSVDGKIVLDMDGENILSRTFYQLSSSGSVSAVEPQAGIWFVPTYQSYSSKARTTQWLPSSTTKQLETSSTALAFNFVRLPVGTPVFSGLAIEDIAGNTDIVTFRGAAPAE